MVQIYPPVPKCPLAIQYMNLILKVSVQNHDNNRLQGLFLGSDIWTSISSANPKQTGIFSQSGVSYMGGFLAAELSSVKKKGVYLGSVSLDPITPTSSLYLDAGLAPNFLQ